MRDVFHRIRRRVLVLAILVLTALLLGSSIYWHRTGNQHPVIRPIAESTAVSATETQAAINRGKNYLKQNLDQVAPYQRLMLDFLQRKFQLDPAFSGEVTPIASYAEPSEATMFAATERIAYRDRLVDTLPPLTTTTDSMIMYAANCDRIPLPSGYETVLQQNVQEGSYAMTHVVFAFDFLHDNGCTIPASWNKIRQQAFQGTLRFARNPAVDQDLRYESIAFVLHDDLRAETKPAAIKQILHEQRKDGGWGGAATDTTMQDHQTMLALWALLEYAHPEAPKEPLIRH